MTNELYDRQKTLELVEYDRALVVGAGGIGSWVVLNMALSGRVGEIVVCDPDVIEDSNLNRTPYMRQQVGMYKVWAIRELVTERRHDVMIVPEKCMVQNMESGGDFDVVVDCSDGLRVKEWALTKKFPMYVKLGYDGWSATMDFSNVMTWGEIDGDGYSVVPSFVVPPVVLAALAVGMLLSGDIPNGVKTFDVRDIFEKV